MIPLWIRVVHWVIALLFMLLIVTGLTQHFATVQFSIMDYSIATTVHEISGIVLSIVYPIFLIGIFITRYWRKYLPRGRKLWRLIWRETQFHGRNPLMIFLLVPILVVTGLIYYYPNYAPTTVLGFDGLWTIAASHYIVSTLALAYTIGHIFMAFFDGTLRMMLFGSPRIARVKTTDLYRGETNG